MIHFSNYASPLRRQAAALSVLIAGLVFVSAASAVDLDFNVASGNFTTSGNWLMLYQPDSGSDGRDSDDCR